MAISNLNYSAPRPYVAPRAAAPAEPTGGNYYAPPVQYKPQSTGLPIGKMVAWAGGALGARSLFNNFFRNPRGFGLLAVLGVGAFAGNWVYNKLTGR